MSSLNGSMFILEIRLKYVLAIANSLLIMKFISHIKFSVDLLQSTSFSSLTLFLCISFTH